LINTPTPGSRLLQIEQRAVAKDPHRATAKRTHEPAVRAARPRTGPLKSPADAIVAVLACSKRAAGACRSGSVSSSKRSRRAPMSSQGCRRAWARPRIITAAIEIAAVCRSHVWRGRTPLGGINGSGTQGAIKRASTTRVIGCLVERQSSAPRPDQQSKIAANANADCERDTVDPRDNNDGCIRT
jgi:hypothetical protein